MGYSASTIKQVQSEGDLRMRFSSGKLIRKVLLFSSCFVPLLLGLFTSTAFSADRIAILYPELTTTYKDVFQEIVDGIKTQNTFQIQLYPLPQNYEGDKLHEALQKDRIAGIIALGKRGYFAAKNLPGNLPTVYGALPLVPNGITGISLSADPQQIFSRLKKLVPGTQKVFVVYSPQINQWLIPIAERAAQKLGISLQPFPADSLREAMYLYRNLLRDIRGQKNAIWLPLDQITANDDVVLPMLLQKAWEKNLVICSSKPTHVQRGALFSMYPDNFGLGEDLVKILKNKLSNKDMVSVKPLEKLQLAVNLRTAAHLGLNYSPNQQQEFNLTFPSR